jgi:hypothetical protein
MRIVVSASSLVAVAALFLVGSQPLAGKPSRASVWKGIEAIPGHSSVPVVVEKKQRTYFRATPQQPLLVPIGGPARLRVVSRVEFPKGTDDPIAYGVSVATERKLLEVQKTQSLPSSYASIRKNAVRLGQSRQMLVSIPKGKVMLKISVEGKSPVLIRLLKAPPIRRGEKTITLTPIDAPRGISLKEDEKLIPYFSALPGRSVRYRLVGPTTLHLITRLDFDATMRGEQSYRLAITEGEKTLREVEYRTTKALTATYPDLKDLIPSKFRRLTLPIAAGTHEISVALLKPRSGSVEIHARIPELDVGSAE